MMPCATTPNISALRIISARRAAANRAFDGTQPVLRQSPPILWLSISTVGTPKAAAAAATESPPGPPPMTQISGVSISAIPPNHPYARQSLLISHGGGRACAPPHHHRHQYEQTERDQRGDHLRGENTCRVEDHSTIGFAGRQTLVILIDLCGDHAIEAGAGKSKHDSGRNDSERRRGHERAQAHTGKGRHQIDKEEREQRHQPKEKKIPECFLAKPPGKLIGTRARPPQQRLAEGGARRKEDERGADGGADYGGRSANDDAEQEATRNSEKCCTRQRECSRHDIDADISEDGQHTMFANESIDRRAMPDERVE